VAYVPTRVFIGSYELAGISLSVPCVVGMQAVAVVVMFLVYKLLWYLGIKKFTGWAHDIGHPNASAGN